MVPALGFHFLTRCYDPLASCFFRKIGLWPRLLEMLDPQPGERVLDLGCGPGRLAIAVKEQCPSATMTAIDIDTTILTIARRNAKRAQVVIDFRKQDLVNLEVAGDFDWAYSSMVFHHLTTAQKERALEKIKKLLKPGGRFIVADFCRTENRSERIRAWLIRLLHSYHRTTPHFQGWLENNLPHYFSEVERTAKIPTLFGPIGIFICKK